MSPTMTSMNPSILLLGEQNWNQWRTYIRGRLLTKGLWYVMDVTKSGDRRVGESTEAAKTRLQTDMDKAYRIIIEGIEPSQYQYIEDAETATAAYKALSDHHEPKSKIDKLALSSEYHSMSWNIKEETLPEFLERRSVTVANGTKTVATKVGTMTVETSMGTKLKLQDVLVVEGMPSTLMSIPMLMTNEKFGATFINNTCTLTCDSKAIAKAVLHPILKYIQGSTPKERTIAYDRKISPVASATGTPPYRCRPTLRPTRIGATAQTPRLGAPMRVLCEIKNGKNPGTQNEQPDLQARGVLGLRH
ncbi:hypothetical protein DYB28_008489 [Aphanomyces astaci]|uniref:Retrovirus-related Pol polyprotein from transposon TNT 1-94-like beta-barrel domain-containing protein n=1 Tax=Aphanomyces astaci TaxID=112090 RepID=A0A9X8E5W1_APHAT|nr:hypothetical protein DYB28_008489 [Aphanomyces astaci]